MLRANPKSLKVHRSYLRAVLFGAFTLAPAVAHASVASCVEAHSKGQAERNAGHLQNARAEFLACSTEECPGQIQSECSTLLTEVEGFMASVVFAAVGSDGKDVVDVKVTVDGEQVLDQLSGLATNLDPGSHEVGYTWPDGFAQKETIVVAQGEKNRRFEMRRVPTVTEKLDATPAAAPPSRKPPVAAWVVGGLGVAALGSFATFAVLGKQAESAMDSCKPYCEQSQADKMRLRYLIADISLGVGVAAVGVSGFLFVRASRTPARSTNEAELRSVTVGMRGTF